MKLNLSLRIAAISLATAAPAIPPGYNDPPRVDGQQFFLNGKVQRLAGTNAWWMGHLTTDEDVETAMSQIASVSATKLCVVEKALMLVRAESKLRVSGALGTPTHLPMTRSTTNLSSQTAHRSTMGPSV